jgi:peptidoglycan/LPS O-acetylase OafA/YrhL
VQTDRFPQFNNLDVFRTVLAVGVLVYHCLLFANVRTIQFPWVPAFIAISGFLITDSMSRSAGWGHFAFKRLLRVGPGFLVSLVLVYAVGGDVGATLVNWLTMGIRSTGTNQPIWSLGMEEVLYFLLAVWFALGLYRSPGRAICFLAALFALLLAVSASTEGQVFLILRAALAFVCGSALYVLRSSIRWSPLAGMLCLGLAFYLRNWASIDSWAAMVLTGPALAYGLISLGVYARPVFGSYKSLVGDPSYGIYLYHWPILVFLEQRGLRAELLLLVTLATTAVLAIASWHLLEKRVLRAKDAFTRINEGQTVSSQRWTGRTSPAIGP